MAVIPMHVALPCPPQLATCILDSCGYLDGAFPSPVVGEFLNIVCGTPDGKLVYAAARAPQGLREGWLPGNAFRLLEPHEASEVPQASRLSPAEALQRTTLASVAEDWHEFDQPTTLSLRAGAILQVSTLREARGWGYGWMVDAPDRRGWFPLAMIRRVESSISSLVEGKDDIQLTATATDALRSLLQSVPQPPPRQPVWQGELPPIVAKSAQQAAHEMQEAMEQTQAEASMAAQEAGGALEPRQEEVEDAYMPNLVPEDLPEDCYPLVVCKQAFTPPKRSKDSLLKLGAGDLARVTSMLDSAMYHGFVEGRPTERGWFPRRNVVLLEDPLSSQADSMAVDIDRPSMPEVPPALLQQKRIRA